MTVWVVIVTAIHVLSLILFYLVRRAINHFIGSQQHNIGKEHYSVITGKYMPLFKASYFFTILIITVFSYYVILS